MSQRPPKAGCGLLFFPPPMHVFSPLPIFRAAPNGSPSGNEKIDHIVFSSRDMPTTRLPSPRIVAPLRDLEDFFCRFGRTPSLFSRAGRHLRHFQLLPCAPDFWSSLPLSPETPFLRERAKHPQGFPPGWLGPAAGGRSSTFFIFSPFFFRAQALL